MEPLTDPIALRRLPPVLQCDIFPARNNMPSNITKIPRIFPCAVLSSCNTVILFVVCVFDYLNTYICVYLGRSFN